MTVTFADIVACDCTDVSAAYGTPRSFTSTDPPNRTYALSRNPTADAAPNHAWIGTYIDDPFSVTYSLDDATCTDPNWGPLTGVEVKLVGACGEGWTLTVTGNGLFTPKLIFSGSIDAAHSTDYPLNFTNDLTSCWSGVDEQLGHGGTATITCGCVCSDHATLTATLAGTSIVGTCSTCPDFGGDGSMSGPGGDFDGVYTLTRDGCCWRGSISKTVNLWSTVGDCSGDPSDIIDTFAITLCLVTGETTYWTFLIEGTGPGFMTAQLFNADPVTTDANWCASLPEFTNTNTVTCGFGTFFAGGGGSAIISP